MKIKLLLINIVVVLTIACQKPANHPKIDLAGTWQYAMDPLDEGTGEAWYNRTLADTLKLPGSLTSNGKGDDITLTTPWTGQIVDSSVVTCRSAQ